MPFPSVGKLDPALGVLFTLLPGLVTFLVVRSLSARERKLDPTEVVLHGLAYTLIVHAIWQLLKSLGSWVATPDIVGLSLTAVAIGVLLAWLFNRAVLYSWFQRLGITDESNWASIWETAFREFRAQGGDYAVMHLRDGRPIMGAIRGHSASQVGGHICLESAGWLPSEGNALPLVELPGRILLCPKDVAFVEFVPSPRNG
jgi:hypothetical protein